MWTIVPTNRGYQTLPKRSFATTDVGDLAVCRSRGRTDGRPSAIQAGAFDMSAERRDSELEAERVGLLQLTRRGRWAQAAAFTKQG